MLLIAHRNVLLLFAFLALVAICCCVPDAEKREGSVPGAAAYSAQLRMEAQGSRRKRALPAAILVPLIVGNVLSVIAGSFANDMIVANTWHKTTFCVRVLYRYRLTSSGWKRCWDYARQSSKKWRRLLKQHHLAGILRIIVRRLRANSEVRFKEALLLIQAEHDKLLMSGDQVVRVHQMLSDAGIVLPAFQQNAGRKEPLSLDAPSLDKWSQLDGPEKDLFIAYVEIVRMLCIDYEHFFGAVIHPKLLTLHSSVVQMRRIDGKLELEAQQQHLTGLSEFSRKFLTQFVTQLHGESSARTRNILFLNVQFALYARALTKMAAAKADDASATFGDRLRQQSAFVECILQIAKEKESQIFWGKTEAEAAEWAGKNVQEIAERLQLDKDELQNLEEFMGNLIPFNAVDLIEDRDHKCARIEALIAKMEFASIVRRENGLMGIELTDVWAQEAAEEITFVRELIGAIERDYLGGGDDSDAFNGDPTGEAELDAMRTNVAEMASNGGITAAINSQDPVVDGQMLRVHTKLALFGHLLAKDWTERQQQLDQVAFFIGADRVRCEPGLSEKLYHFALRLFQADKSGVVNGDHHQIAAFEALVEEVRTQVAKMGNAEMAEDEEGTRDILEQLGQIGVWETRLSAELLERMVEDAKKVGETLKVVKTGSSRVTRKQTKKHSQIRRESNGPWTVHRYDKDKKAVELPSAVEAVERQEKGPTALLTRSRSSPTQSSKQSDARRRRRKRMDMFGTLAQGFGLSLLTGFLGNWISETVDISQTLTNWLLLALRPWRLWRGERPRIIWTVDVRRKKRERGIAQFIERLYLTLFIKLAEVKGRALTEMMHEVEDYIRTAIRQEGIETGKLDLNNVLSELDLFTYRSVRHHVKDRYLKKGQRAAQQWQSQMNTIRAMEEMKYFSERRFESERDKILAEMSATEREQYWAEETVKRPGTFAPTLAVFVKNERAAQISAIKGAEPAKQQLRVVDLGELERELRGKERDQRMLEQRVREMANSAGQLSSSGVDLKLIARKIRENEADIQLKQRENGALKKLLEEHQKLESARKGVDKAKEKLQQMTLKSGNARVQVLDDMQLTALKTLAQLQVLSVLVESLIGEMKAEMVELGGSNWTDERLAHFKRGFEKVLSLVDRLALDKVAIGKKKKAYKNTFKYKLSSVRRAITRMTGLGGRLSGRQTSQVAAVTSENFNNVLLERIAELAYLVEVALKKVKNKKAGTGRNKSNAKGEKGEALLSLNGGSEFGGEWAECEVRKLMRQIVAEANGEEELEQKEGEEGDGDCDQSAMDGLTGAAQKDATGAREH